VQLLGEGAKQDSAWWGKFRVPSGTLTRRFGAEVPEPAVIAGSLVAELLNTSPLTAVIKDRVPRLGWFDDLLTIENVELVSDFRLAGPEVQLRRVKLKGGAKDRLELEAELDLQKQGAEGVLFAAWGPFSAAVTLADEGRDWKLTRSRRWYAEQAAAYRAAHTAPSATPPIGENRPLGGSG